MDLLLYQYLSRIAIAPGKISKHCQHLQTKPHNLCRNTNHPSQSAANYNPDQSRFYADFLNSFDATPFKMYGNNFGLGKKTIPICCINPSASPWPQCSTIFPFSTRSMCIIDKLICLPVGGRPWNSPRCVAVNVPHVTTLSSATTTWSKMCWPWLKAK